MTTTEGRMVDLRLEAEAIDMDVGFAVAAAVAVAEAQAKALARAEAKSRAESKFEAFARSKFEAFARYKSEAFARFLARAILFRPKASHRPLIMHDSVSEPVGLFSYRPPGLYPDSESFCPVEFYPDPDPKQRTSVVAIAEPTAKDDGDGDYSVIQRTSVVAIAEPTAEDDGDGDYSVVAIAEPTAEDDGYSTSTKDDGYSTSTIEDYESPPLPATESDDFSTSPIRYISSSQADSDDIDSDNAHSKIEQVIQQVSGTNRDDVVRRVRSVRLKYKIPWNAAAYILFFRLIKSALKVQHSSEGEFAEYIENMLFNWKDTLKYFLPNRFSQVEALHELEKACLKAKQSFSVFPIILSCLYKHNILFQRTIVHWAQDAGWKYGSNETLVKESSELIKTLKEGLCKDDDVNQIPLYGSEDVYEGHGFDDKICTSEVD